MENVQRKQALQRKNAVWSGYGEPYVQNIVYAGSKVLKLLATITFDVGLLYWVHGLTKHLEEKMREAEQEKENVKRYTF